MILFKNLIRLTYLIFFVFICLIILFGRTASGITIFNFRLAEYFLGFCLLFSLILFINNIDFLRFNKEIKKIIKLNKLFIIVFLYIFFRNFSSPDILYVIKSSSFIWVVCFLYIGYLIPNYVNYEKYLSYIFAICLMFLYLLSTTYFPPALKSFLSEISDKFDFVKASVVTASYMFTNLFLKKNTTLRVSSIYFFFSSSVFLPLIIYQSKGALIGFLVFFSYYFVNLFQYLIKNKIYSIIILTFSIILFSMSIFQVYGDLTFFSEKSEEEKLVTEIKPKDVSEKVVESVQKKTTTNISRSLFYIEEGRLYSSDNTANWRLQIWQDVLFDLQKSNNLMFGYGFQDKIPAMQKEGRSGIDKTNENVHNYFVTIFARGGLIFLTLYLVFFILMLKSFKKLFGNFELLFYILPFLIISMFDTSMESIRYPLLFYTGIGYLFSGTNKSETINM